MLYMSNRLCENLIVKFVNENRFEITINSQPWSVYLFISTTHWSSLKQLTVNRNWLHNGECKFGRPSPIHVLPLRTVSFCFLRSWVHLRLSKYKLIGYVQLCMCRYQKLSKLMRSYMVMSIYTLQTVIRLIRDRKMMYCSLVKEAKVHSSCVFTTPSSIICQ